jgi:hypothetical protein
MLRQSLQERALEHASCLYPDHELVSWDEAFAEPYDEW